MPAPPRTRFAASGRKAPFFAALAVGLLTFAAPSLAHADGVAPARRHMSPTRKPAGVPSGYVLTRNGFFDPSCVITVASGDVVGGDGVIRGQDGAEHGRFGACAQPRFSVAGRAVPPPPAAGEAHAPPPLEAATVTYDGYIVWYSYNGPLAIGTTLVTDWTVPLAPLATAEQDIAFFNDILTTAGGGDILQPVLDYNGEVQNHWAIESEHCCISGNDMQTTPIDVNAGDAIRGTVVGTGCDATGVCQNWSVTTADITTGKSTTLSTTAPMGVPNGASPGSLETYGVTACDLFPASGEITFTDNVATAEDGGVQKLTYRLTNFQGVAAEVPTNCGYGGSSAGTSFTLVFGPVDGGAGATVPDAGPGADASAGTHDVGSVADARADGARDASGDATTGGRDAAVEDATAGGSSSGGSGSSGSSSGSSGSSGGSSSGSSGSSGASSGGGNAMADAATGSDAASSDGNTPSDAKGCSCDVVASGRDSATWTLVGALAAVVGIGRRRRRRL